MPVRGLLIQERLKRVAALWLRVLSSMAFVIAASVWAQSRSARPSGGTAPDLGRLSDRGLHTSKALEEPATQTDASIQLPVPQTNAPISVLDATSEPQAGSARAWSPMGSPRLRLETARYLRKTRRYKKARALLVGLLGANSAESMRQSALLELAALAQDQDELSRAQAIYAQFLNRWAGDSRAPEVLLRQGLNFRRMGLNEMALNKFYAVMTAALTLKSTQLDMYERLVLQAQVEIAQTHYDLGRYSQAADFFSRLLQQQDAGLDRPRILYQLVCCYQNTTNYDQIVASGENFLAHYPDAAEVPEVRFDLALALNHLGRHNDALLQVLHLLKEQSAHSKQDPASWAYWRRRTGNLIANQLYQEGDYARALEIYSSLAQLDTAVRWQLPVWYQMGLTYEHLWQPEKALGIYDRIIRDGQELGTNAPPNLATIVSMAQWRTDFLHWRDQAEVVNGELEKRNAAIDARARATNSVP